MLRDPYLHPSGQIPAYEWNFGDVNPPVHAWSTIFTHNLQQIRFGEGDIDGSNGPSTGSRSILSGG